MNLIYMLFIFRAGFNNIKFCVIPDFLNCLIFASWLVSFMFFVHNYCTYLIHLMWPYKRQLVAVAHPHPSQLRSFTSVRLDLENIFYKRAKKCKKLEDEILTPDSSARAFKSGVKCFPAHAICGY